MSKALGIINFSGNHIWVTGLQDYRPIGAMSFLGRYRVIDFPLSNMSNSGIDQIQVYINHKPRSLVDHIGTGRHYNINSKNGKIRILFSENGTENSIYDHEVAAYIENMECIEDSPCPYVVIAPSYMVYSMDFDSLLQNHIDSEADITLLYHSVDNAKDHYLNCDLLNLNRQKGVLSIEKNRGGAKNRNIFMDTYVMKKELFIELIQKGHEMSSMYTLPQIVNLACSELDIRGVSHRGFFAPITDLKSYYDANLSLLDFKEFRSAFGVFDNNWPIYTRTTDSCPTQYFDTSSVKSSFISNGCLIEGTVENSIIGRGCIIKSGAVVKNTVLLPGTYVGEDVHIENQVVDKRAKLIHAKEILAAPENPGYIKRNDTV